MVLNVDVCACAVSVTTTTVVLGGYAVLPSTLVGIGSVVMLVKYDFLVADVFGNEVTDDVSVSCLGKTAALMGPTAKAIALRRRNCIFDQVVLSVLDVSLKMDKPWQWELPGSCTYRHCRVEG